MRPLGISGLWVLLLVVSPVHAQAAEQKTTTFGFDGTSSANGAPVPWEVRSVAGRPSFKVVPADDGKGGKHLYLHSVNSSFSVNQKVNLILGPSTRTHVSWSWKGEKLPEGREADARVGSDCDQGLQVMLAFDDGDTIISYVWDTNAPVGTRTTEGFRVPLFGGKLVKVIVVQSGHSGVGQWSAVERDVANDFREVFGKDAKKIVAIRIQSNSQYTGTEGAGYFSPITFTQREQ